MSQGNYTSLGDAFPQLINLTLETTGRTPHMGGQNFTHCCLLAVNESLSVVNGFIVENTLSFVEATVDNLLAATADGQFPCTAQWNGNISGAPVVQVPASWLEKTCPGWQVSSSMLQSQWISPFVGFLLPAIIFCLSVPRRRQLTIYEKLFSLDFSRPMAWLLAPFDMIMAWLSAVLDTIIWLSTCFAFAGPMLMSGLYEAYLDNLLLRFIRDKTKASQLTLDMRVRLLFILLCGNLDLDPDLKGDQMQLIDIRNPENSEHWPNYSHFPRPGLPNTSSAWAHIEYLIHPLRTYRDMAIMTPRQLPMHDIRCEVEGCQNADCLETPIPRTPQMIRLIGQTKTRLRTMLSCQLSFGVTVGAPVVFYLGTFIFTIVTTLTNLGDHDTSIEIAFGMWYMILPHIAIVSGLLLAGNNPIALEGVVAHDIGDAARIYSPDEEQNPLNEYFELAYQSRYRPQWLWLRGRSKRQWIQKLYYTYRYQGPPEQDFSVPDQDMSDLRRKTSMGIKGWAIVLALTLLFLETPYVLAFLTAFYTPQIGVSCRSLTFTIHAINQLCLMFLWLWAWGGAPENCSGYFQSLGKGHWLDESGFYTPTKGRLSWRHRETRFTMQTVWAVMWFSCAALLGVSSVFVSIGGTLMQLIGVYRSDFCDLNAPWWSKAHADVQIVLSSNTTLDIKDAKEYWTSTGIAATSFLAVVCFGGWWYQRRLRGLFGELISELGNPETEREDVLAAIWRMKRGESSVKASSK